MRSGTPLRGCVPGSRPPWGLSSDPGLTSSRHPRSLPNHASPCWNLCSAVLVPRAPSPALHPDCPPGPPADHLYYGAHRDHCGQDPNQTRSKWPWSGPHLVLCLVCYRDSPVWSDHPHGLPAKVTGLSSSGLPAVSSSPSQDVPASHTVLERVGGARGQGTGPFGITGASSTPRVAPKHAQAGQQSPSAHPTSPKSHPFTAIVTVPGQKVDPPLVQLLGSCLTGALILLQCGPIEGGLGFGQ